MSDPTNDNSLADEVWGPPTARPQPTGTAEGIERALTASRPARQGRTGFLGWLDRILGRDTVAPLSPEEQQMQDWVATIRNPIAGGNHRITVSTHKGGAGKTTTSLAIGTVLSLYRPDQTVVIDSNPDRGTLSNQLVGSKEHARTIRDLLANIDRITCSQDIRQFTHLSPSRLEVLASDKDPYKARGVSTADYDLVQRALGTYRDILITDTGTDMTLPLYDEIINYTDTLVVAANTAVEDAKLALDTLRTWYVRGEDSRGEALVPNAVVAVFERRSEDGDTVELDWLVGEYAALARRVVVIPHDPYLARGTVFDWEKLQPATQRAYIELTAAIAEAFRPS